MCDNEMNELWSTSNHRDLTDDHLNGQSTFRHNATGQWQGCNGDLDETIKAAFCHITINKALRFDYLIPNTFTLLTKQNWDCFVFIIVKNSKTRLKLSNILVLQDISYLFIFRKCWNLSERNMRVGTDDSTFIKKAYVSVQKASILVDTEDPASVPKRLIERTKS